MARLCHRDEDHRVVRCIRAARDSDWIHGKEVDSMFHFYTEKALACFMTVAFVVGTVFVATGIIR